MQTTTRLSTFASKDSIRSQICQLLAGRVTSKTTMGQLWCNAQLWGTLDTPLSTKIWGSNGRHFTPKSSDTTPLRGRLAFNLRRVKLVSPLKKLVESKRQAGLKSNTIWRDRLRNVLLKIRRKMWLTNSCSMTTRGPSENQSNLIKSKITRKLWRDPWICRQSNARLKEAWKLSQILICTKEIKSKARNKRKDKIMMTNKTSTLAWKNSKRISIKFSSMQSCTIKKRRSTISMRSNWRH